MIRSRYSLTGEGDRRCQKDEFYLQQTSRYKGYTEKIFRTLYGSKPLTIQDISEVTGIDKRAINGIITFNLMAGYIKRVIL